MPAGENEDRTKTRERFNEVFKKYTEKEKKKVKKKTPEVQENVVLQSMRKNLNLAKRTEDDETVLQNSYDPERSSPRFSKNRRRETKARHKVNREDGGTSRPKRRTQQALPSGPGGPEGAGCPGAPGGPRGAGAGQEEDGLLQEYQQRIAEQETSETAAKQNDDAGKKKKKKKKSVSSSPAPGSTRRFWNQDEGLKISTEVQGPVPEEPPGEQEDSGDVDNETESKGKKKKKQRGVATRDADSPPDEGLVLAVLVHRTDVLQTDLLVSHPMVKVHVVDELTGQYVKKEDRRRPVSSFYERESVEHVLPIMTQPFHFREKKSAVPEWQEQIVFNERFGRFVQQDAHAPRVLLFFEILDLVTMEGARNNVEAEKRERGFRKIAWAFLKLVGTNGVLNVDRKLRLQLFCRPQRVRTPPGAIEVVEWWRKQPRTKYGSTLFVTVRGVRLPEQVDPCVRSMMALQEERGSTSFSELQNRVTHSPSTPSQTHLAAGPVRWSRLPGQVCRIPNKAVLMFRGGQLGCFTLLFSHDGTRLAAACVDRDAFPVIIYEIPSGKVLAAFLGHFKIVYDLCWSRDDGTLLSASSDGTVREWDVQGLRGTARKVLPHPSFVYCARYHPAAQSLVLTGGYDGLLRVWRLDPSPGDQLDGHLLQEFQAHCVFISAICFDAEGRRTFSADASGRIIVWRTTVTNDQQPCRLWAVEKTVEDPELRGVPVSSVQLLPNGRQLLVHSRDSLLRIIDLRILAVKRFSGASNQRQRTGCALTPCGSFVFAGSEDGTVFVWNAHTGDPVAVYSELCCPAPLHGVTFHPHDNMVAFCSLSPNQPVQVYLYDPAVSQLKTWSRSVSLDTKTLLDSPDLSSSSAAMTALKLQCVKEQLDSVLKPRRTPSTCGFAAEPDKPDGSQTGTSEPGTALSLQSPCSRLCGPQAEPLFPGGSSPVSQGSRAAAPCRLPAVSAGVPLDTDPVQEEVSLHEDSSARLIVPHGDNVQHLSNDNLRNRQQRHFLGPSVQDHGPSQIEERWTPTKVSAAISSSGELRFYPEPLESDREPDPEDTGRRGWRKKQVEKVPGAAGTCSSLEAAASGQRTRRSTSRPLPRPAGLTLT